MTKTGLRWGFVTDVGVVRRANQDSGMANGSLFMVADGMGGHRGGEVASQIAADHFTTIEEVSSVEELRDAVVHANNKIREVGSNDPELVGMGTTVVAMAVLPTSKGDETLRFAAANVGDSRLYLFENDELAQVSEDHSLVAELEKAGQITPEEAMVHPQRNVVTRALGPEADVQVDTWELDVRLEQRYLMCSDGLINEVDDDSICGALETFASPADAAQHLVQLANAAGGRDNITVLVLDVVPVEDVAPEDDTSEE